jgi:hypothetical protein
MRQWRHVELPAILRIYHQNATRFVGTPERGEAYSRWLISRGAFDSILVALVGQDRYDLHETSARIVGYCIQSGNRVLELLADPEFPGLERDILARVCAEAIENGIRETQELGIESPSFRGSVIVAEGRATVQQGRVGRSWLKLADDELARLLLGQCDPVEAVARGTMEPSTQMAQRLAGILFPRQSLWCPVWDDVPA